jgi:LAO/AO transport system kinase
MTEQSGANKERAQFKKKVTSSELSVEDLIIGVQKGVRSRLAQAITLIESNAEHHFQKGQQLLQNLLPQTGKSMRIGITGVPGAGKSTLIEAFGMYLCEQGFKVAVLAVDPSSSISGGSILGDKTRMGKLANHPNAYIRPSPSGGKLGGVHRKTRETMLLCEAAGFDVIIVETVGVGQSEMIVREMVDMFLLLVLTGAGDELQGMKKGVMELADTIIVNKADGSNKPLAEKTCREYKQMVHFLQPATKGWDTPVLSCSALFHEGIEEIWQMIQQFEGITKQTGVFEERRRIQTRDWLYSMITDQLQSSFFQNTEIKRLLPQMESEVLAGAQTVTVAVEHLLHAFFTAKNNDQFI